jgi:Tfp pilus assembly protein PilF
MTLSTSDMVKMLCDYGAELHTAHKFKTGAAVFRRALAMEPGSASAHNGLGSMLYNLGEHFQSEVHLLRALAEEPKSSAACGNLGLLYAAMRRWDESEKAFQRGLSLAPGDVGLRWNMANMLLESGQWRRGLQEYEVRIQHRGVPNFPRMPYPMWGGESLDGKTIFIQAEQGIGDRLLTSRYLCWLKQRFPSSRVLYLSNANMHSIMWEFRDLLEFVPEGIPWPRADYGLFEMSLVRLYHMMEQAPNDEVELFLPPDSGLIRRRAEMDRRSVNLPEPNHKSLKVGICWTGNPAMDRNFERSVPLEMLLPLAELPDVTLYSLQVGSNDILRLGANQVVCDLAPEIDGKLARTAAAMLHLDLVITVCTSVAHLAGSLGVPTWVMLCHSPYWVWLSERADSPWYPNVSLFRQPRPGDWGSVVSNVKAQLEQLATRKLDRAA